MCTVTNTCYVYEIVLRQLSRYSLITMTSVHISVAVTIPVIIKIPRKLYFPQCIPSSSGGFVVVIFSPSKLFKSN